MPPGAKLCCSSNWQDYDTELNHSTAGSLTHSLEVSLIVEVSGAYKYSLTRYQLATESATVVLLAGAGDFCAQLREQKGDMDLHRCRIFALKGSVSGMLWSK